MISYLANVENPLDGVSPSIDVFGQEFDAKITLILGGIWALALIVCVIAMMIQGGKWATARRQGQTLDGETASDNFFTALKATGVVIALPLIIGALIFILG